jgi:hypothetical protein
MKISKLTIKINHHDVGMYAEMLDQVCLTKQEENLFTVNRSDANMLFLSTKNNKLIFYRLNSRKSTIDRHMHSTSLFNSFIK